MQGSSEGSEDAYRVLVVDDNAAIHSDFRRVLAAKPESSALDDLERRLFAEVGDSTGSASTFVVDTASQGEEAIEMVRRSVESGKPYQVAFVDVRMPPGLDGVETISRMWQIDPAIQAVICTAYSDHSWEDITRVLGYGDGLLVLRKPFEPIEALQMAHALTRKWALGAEVKDIETGLCDWFGKNGERDVLLCWRFGEPRCAFFHDLDAGFAGRRPVSELLPALEPPTRIIH